MMSPDLCKKSAILLLEKIGRMVDHAQRDLRKLQGDQYDEALLFYVDGIGKINKLLATLSLRYAEPLTMEQMGDLVADLAKTLGGDGADVEDDSDAEAT